MRSGSAFSRVGGFTLIEVLVALSVAAMAALVLAGMTVRVVRDCDDARRQTIATRLAAGRIEQLRALSWGLGDAGAPAPVSDSTTDLSGVRAGTGGSGLSSSPADSLDRNEPGQVDFEDNRGAWLGAGAAPPAGTVFVRRWCVTAVPGLGDAVALQVRVSALRPDASVSPWTDSHTTSLVAVKARTAG